MSKPDRHRDALRAFGQDASGAAAYLVAHSGLPGPRANLELASAFADLASQGELAGSWQETLFAWAAVSAREAPTNHPGEYLPFVAVQALGAMWPGQDDATRDRIEAVLRGAANDPRWRMREACAFGLQRVGGIDPASLVEIARRWMASCSNLDRRAVLAGLADPTLLEDADLAGVAFEASNEAVEAIATLSEEQLRSEDAKALVKALGFAPSVFVAAHPAQGFRMLEAWADRGSLPIAKIVASNLRKARLARRYPDEVQDVGMRLQASFGD